MLITGLIVRFLNDCLPSFYLFLSVCLSIQVALLVKDSMSEDDKKFATEKRIHCLQLLLLLIPEANYTLLKDLLTLLKKISEHEDRNKMSAMNLGTMFAPLVTAEKRNLKLFSNMSISDTLSAKAFG